MTYHAEIIAVGTELLLGNIANTDAQELSQALASVGVDVLYHTVVGDNPQRLEEAIAIARKRADPLQLSRNKSHAVSHKITGSFVGF